MPGSEEDGAVKRQEDRVTSSGSPGGSEGLDNLGTSDTPEDKPPSGGPDEDRAELHDRCNDARETMTPHETADCAGAALAEEFEREEDGGS